MKLLAPLFLLFCCSALVLSQTSQCDLGSDYVVDREKPSVYLAFEQFGKANDWKESKLGEWSDKSAIKKGNDIWLRLHNNSCWEITFTTDSLYVSKTTVDGKPKMIFGVLENGAIANIQYRVEEQDGKHVPSGAHGGSLSSLPSGHSAVFGILREYLESDRSIYIPFRYGWEKKTFSSNLEPMHRSFFWGYRLEEVKKK